jgi:hypothetical protein
MPGKWKAALTLMLVFLFTFSCSVWALEKGDEGDEGDEGETFKEGDEKKLKSGDRDPKLLEKINTSIVRGCEFLKSRQLPDGSWQGTWFKFAEPHKYTWGETALSLLALLKSGQNRNSEPIVKGFKFLRTQPLKKCYEVSVLLMALEARWARQDLRARIQEITQAEPKAKLPPGDLDWMREAVRFLLEHREMSWRLYGMDKTNAGQTPDTWHYPGPSGTTTDHSNTQLAILGLKSARRCGIPVPQEVWINTVKHFIETQERSGPPVRRVRVIEDRKHGYRTYKPLTEVPDHARGWCYDAAKNGKTGSGDNMTASTGSMTCVGIASLAIALSELRGRGALSGMLRKKSQTAMKDGLAWLDLHFTVQENPKRPDRRWHFYYLYGIERAAVLTSQRSIGKHDWYREGAEYLIANQSGDGSWDDAKCPGVLNNTCFALLFLTKATVPVGTVITGRH